MKFILLAIALLTAWLLETGHTLDQVEFQYHVSPVAPQVWCQSLDCLP